MTERELGGSGLKVSAVGPSFRAGLKLFDDIAVLPFAPERLIGTKNALRCAVVFCTPAFAEAVRRLLRPHLGVRF